MLFFFFSSLLFFASRLRFLVIASFECAFRSKHTFSGEQEEFLLGFDAAATNVFDSMNCDEDVGFIICKIIIIIISIQRSHRIDFYVKQLAPFIFRSIVLVLNRKKLKETKINLIQFEFSLLWHFYVRFEYVAEKRRNVSRVCV